MYPQDRPQNDPAPSDEQKAEGPQELAPEANTGAMAEPEPGAPEMSSTPLTPEQFHEQLQQSPQQADQPQPLYGQPQQPQYPSQQYSQPDYRPAPPPPVTPQQPAMGGDYRPDSQAIYDRPAQPPQYAGGDYGPDQPQYGGGDYRPQQPQTQPYYTSGPPMGPPPQPPKKGGLPVWAWVLPLVVILLAAGGLGAWAFMAAQEKSASDAKATATAIAYANGTSTAIGRQTVMAVAQASVTAQAAASATAFEMSFATMIAGLDSTPTQAAAVIIEPVRMPVEEFIALYEDPAKRPLIVDVRTAQSYAEGHIAGAVSIPDAETESRLSELPKDKLIIAYCQ